MPRNFCGRPTAPKDVLDGIPCTPGYPGKPAVIPIRKPPGTFAAATIHRDRTSVAFLSPRSLRIDLTTLSVTGLCADKAERDGAVPSKLLFGASPGPPRSSLCIQNPSTAAPDPGFARRGARIYIIKEITKINSSFYKLNWPPGDSDFVPSSRPSSPARNRAL